MNSRTERSTVVVECTGVGLDAVHQGLEKLGVEGRIAAARSIAIKVNLAAGHSKDWTTGVTTNPATVASLVTYLRRYNPDAAISVVESDSVGNGLAFKKFEHNGYYDLAERLPGVAIVDLSRDRHFRLTFDRSYYLSTVTLPLILRESDLFFTLAKAKTHNVTTITGALKNQFGCLPTAEKSRYHPYIDEVIADVNTVFRPDICIIDGSPGMVGNGPISGDAFDFGYVLVANDPVAADAVLADLMGYRPSRIGHIALSARAGIGEADLSRINVIGDTASARVHAPGPRRAKRALVDIGIGIQRVGVSLAHSGDEVHKAGTFWELAIQTPLYRAYRESMPLRLARAVAKRVRGLI